MNDQNFNDFISQSIDIHCLFASEVDDLLDDLLDALMMIGAEKEYIRLLEDSIAGRTMGGDENRGKV